jgi:NADH-quinone oxidoreductase subunit C
VRARFGSDVLGFDEAFGHGVVAIAPQRYRDLAQYLRDDPDLALDYLDFTCGVDLGEEGIEVVTHLYSTAHGHQVRLKVRCDAAEPRCPTLSDIYAGANWHERETTEMFGVVFEGHPQPVRLLLSEGFEGHPLRKDFELMSREAKPWPGDIEGEEEE